MRVTSPTYSAAFTFAVSLSLIVLSPSPAWCDPKQENCIDSLKSVKLPKPVDWISGKLYDELRSSQHSLLHEKFLHRNKFDQLTTENLTQIEKELRKAILSSTSKTELAIFRFEISTLLLQNRPTRKTAVEASSIIKTALKEKTLPADIRSQAIQVERLADDMIAEGPKKSPLRQVNWAISNQCPLCCKGCYFNFRSAEMSMTQARSIAEKLKSSGVKEIILTGGDPLLSTNLTEYVDILHSMGFKIALDTTGYTLTEEMARSFSGKLSYVGLPLDGTSQAVVETFRKGQSDTLERIQKAASLLKTFNIPIKINTTVTQKNINHLQDIAEFIEINGYAKNWGWSIFQWWDTRAEAKMILEYRVDDEIFSQTISKIRARFPSLKIREGSINDRSRQYFEIMTNGDILNYSEGPTPGSIIMGNILNEPMENLIQSPALNGSSPKFKTWFSTIDPR